jgi:putative peptidoglycan lipid II flippase
MFRRFFAEGAFNLAFVPMFAKKVEAGEDAARFGSEALSGLATLPDRLHARSASSLMPWLVLALASGFAGDERFDLAVLYGRIAFPYILFISLTALLSGVLNSLGRFALAAAAPILMNTVMIAFLLIGYWRRRRYRALADLVGAGRGHRPARPRLVGGDPGRHGSGRAGRG